MRKKLIQFRRIGSPHWETASSEEDLKMKLGWDNTAEVIVPAKPIWVRLWRKLFPMRFIEVRGESISQ